jgi:PAS domain S-box-containing protein
LNLHGPIAPVKARFPGSARAPRSLLQVNAIALLACIGAALAGLGLTPNLEEVTAVWPVSGVALAAFLICGNRIWPGILLANLLFHPFLHVSLPAVLAISVAATLGPAVAAWVLRHLQVDLSLTSVREVLRYSAIVSLPAVAAVPTAGVAALAFTRTWSWEEAGYLWVRWAMADCLSVLAITPLLLWLSSPRHDRQQHHRIPFPVSTAFLCLVTLVCYAASRPVGYPVLLVVVLMTILYSQRQIAIAVLLAVTVALWEVAYRDWLMLDGPGASLSRLLDFLLFMTIGSLLLGAMVAESRRKDGLLLRANQELLKQSEARFEDAFDASAQGMAIITIDSHWIRINAALAKLLGYSRDELLAKSCESITHPDDAAHDHEVMRTMLSGARSSIQFEKRYIHRSGKVIVVHITATLVRDLNDMPANFVVQVMDITDRKRAEELWRFGLENAGDVVWDWNIPDEKIVFSGKVTELLGCDEASAPNTPAGWRVLIHPDDAAEVARRTKALLEVPAYPYSCEYRIRCPDGSHKWVLSRGLVIARDRDDKPIRAVGTIVDMTEIRHLQDKLHQSDKMAALGQLSGGVAHDVNNDLGVIVGSAELILEGSAPGSREELLSSRIISTVKRSTDLVRRMLAFSRRAEIAPEPLDLAVFLKGFLDTLGRTLGSHIQTRLRLADRTSLHWVSLDRSMLESSLINLAINARDAMPGGGVLTVSLSRETGTEERSDSVLLTVADTGTGISEEVQRRIFEPFFTTKPAGGGTGLGLAMVYGFVQQSGGRIDVASELGLGTRFLLRFPAVAPPAGARNIPRSAESERFASAVLVVDDNDALRVTLREQLASLHCTVHEAADFEQAVAILRSGTAIEFILSDFDLGTGANGMELAQWVQEQGYDIPGALMSGHLKSFSRLPPKWQSVHKPVRLGDLKLLLASSRREERAPARPAMDASPSAATILVVEDNENMRFVVAEMLRRANYRTTEAGSAGAALQRLTDDPSIRLVITDLGLPDMPGSTLAETIGRQHPGLEVLLMSGTSSQTEREDVLPVLGQVLRKPFSREALTQRVEEALARVMH